VAVVLTMTAANGLENKFRESFSSVGTDVIYVSRMPWVVMNDFFIYRNRPGIALREAHALEDRFRGQAIVNPTVNGQRDVKYRDQSMESVIIIGTTEKQSVISSAQPQTGRFLLPFDVAYKRDVCVIGSEVQKGIFGAVNPINKTMMIGRTRFRVIGVMEKQGGSFLGGPNFDRQIFVPITSYMRAYSGGHNQEDVNIAVKAPRQEALSDLEYAVIGEMRTIRRLRPTESENFSINKLDTLVGTFNNMMGVLLLVGLIVTSISLFVGAVGVMNIMFVTVTERTREIGIRKAIGATNREIRFQFLAEAILISLIGGFAGIVIGLAIPWSVRFLTEYRLPVSGLSAIIAIVVSSVVGVIFGTVPATRAAQLDPVESLRYE